MAATSASPTDTADNTDELWQIIDEHLLHYGRDFVREFITSASGSYLHTATGRSIIDFSSGQMCATLGHNHAAILEAMRRSADSVIHLDSTMLSPSIAHLAKELCALLPPQLSKVLFLNTGAESNEAAIRLAKLYTNRFEIIGLTGSWHGTHLWSRVNDLCPRSQRLWPGNAGNTSPFRHLTVTDARSGNARGVVISPAWILDFDYVDSVSVGSTAAMVIEPIQSAGGIIVPPEGYMEKLRGLCDERSILLVFDEAQTGLGRVGTNFAFEQQAVVPDILSLSKTLGAGVPLAATIASKEIADNTHEKGYSHYTSHASDPLTVEVGLAVVRTIVSEQLATKADEMGQYLMAGLQALQDKYESIGDLRGRGLLLGVEIVTDRQSKNAG